MKGTTAQYIRWNADKTESEVRSFTLTHYHQACGHRPEVSAADVSAWMNSLPLDAYYHQDDFPVAIPTDKAEVMVARWANQPGWEGRFELKKPDAPVSVPSPVVDTEPVDAEREEIIRQMAVNEYEGDGDIVIDHDAIVSEGDDNGAYVAAWVWVSFSETDLDKEKGENDENRTDDRQEDGGYETC